jgi:deoxyribodipyrimidine photo-lyase
VHLVWHRGDLRTHDHPALAAAVEAGPSLGLVIMDPNILGATSDRRRALFHRNVRALRAAYEDRGGVLVVRHGEPAAELRALADALQTVDAVHAIASYTPYGVQRDAEATRALRAAGIGIRWHDGAYVHSPGTVRTEDDSFYSVFTPFHRRWRSLGTPTPAAPPDRITPPELDAGFDPGDVADYQTDVELPEPGEEAALDALERFVEEELPDYADRRDRLDGAGTSHLSVWITLGVLSVRTAVARAEAGGGPGVKKWLSEVAWRDFMADLLYHRPDLLEQPFQPRWGALEWPGQDRRFRAWRDGETGVPAVDAAMRQLRETGWISNRARMVAAQFLAKNLRVDWRRGEAVFKDWLLDGDTASNICNWQWAAGLGIDNAPYFRVMNPVTQAEKHDPDGEWIRRWAPYSDGDPAPHDPLVAPKPSRKAYLEAAEAVPSAERADPPPAPRRPALDLATPTQLAAVPGVGPATAAAVLDALALDREDELEEVSGVGPTTAHRIRARFDS